MPMGDNVGQVDHVVMMVRSENLDASVARLSELLEIQFEYFEAPRQGVKGALSADSMLEYIAPLGDGSPASDSLIRLLDEKGEGIHSITFGVADARATKERLDVIGVRSREVYDAINEDAPAFMHERFDTTLECHLRERVAGTLFVLSQIERKEERSGGDV